MVCACAYYKTQWILIAFLTIGGGSGHSDRSGNIVQSEVVRLRVFEAEAGTEESTCFCSEWAVANRSALSSMFDIDSLRQRDPRTASACVLGWL